MKLSFVIITLACILLISGCRDRVVPHTSGENVLYNGIELPEQWPPRYSEPDEAREMPVPYLENKPAVMPVNIGRQLFIDDFLIDETNLTPVYHSPVFYEGNPVLKADREWESRNGHGMAAPFSDGVWFDEKAGKFKIWYYSRGSFNSTCYAESTDGKNWEKPILNVHGENNIVEKERSDSQTVWLDKMEKDPAKRYKMFQTSGHRLRGKMQFVLKYSADGINWSEGQALSGSIDDRSTAFYNPFRDVWALSIRYWNLKYELHHYNKEQIEEITKRKVSKEVPARSRTYVEHKDPEMAVSLAHYIKEGVADKNNVFWLAASDKEPRHPKFPHENPGIYNLDAIAYESIMLGFFSVWQGPGNFVCSELGVTKRNEILLGYSRDGFHFSRPSYKPFIGVNEKDGAWNYGNVQSVNGMPIIVGDSLYFYASGRGQPKDITSVDKNMSTGLATLRRDGFVSMRAEEQEGYLTTEILNFDGEFLFVNADLREGNLRVEVCDEKGDPLKGFTRNDCVVMENVNSTRHAITWTDEEGLSSLRGENVRLKFFLTNGDLYSFWISPWKTGESRGYTSGGGPGLSPEGIDQP